MFTHYGRSFFDFVNETQGTMWATYSDNRRQYLQAYQLTDRRVPFPTYAHLLARELPLVDDTPEDDIHELRFRRYFAVSMTVLLLEAQDDYLERQQYPALRDPPQRRLLY